MPRREGCLEARQLCVGTVSCNAARVADERSGNRAGKDKGQALTVFPAFDSAGSMERLLPSQLLHALQTAESVTAGR